MYDMNIYITVFYVVVSAAAAVWNKNKKYTLAWCWTFEKSFKNSSGLVLASCNTWAFFRSVGPIEAIYSLKWFLDWTRNCCIHIWSHKAVENIPSSVNVDEICNHLCVRSITSLEPHSVDCLEKNCEKLSELNLNCGLLRIAKKIAHTGIVKGHLMHLQCDIIERVV